MARESRLQGPPRISKIIAMKKLALCCCAVLASFFPSCASTGPEVPADQATKIRQQRIAPSEDLEETNRAKLGSPLPPSANESTWKF